MPLPVDNSLPHYTVRASRRARRVLLRVNRRLELEVVVPHWYDVSRLSDVIRSKQAWIEGTMDRLRAEGCEQRPEPPRDIVLQAVNERYDIEYDVDADANATSGGWRAETVRTCVSRAYGADAAPGLVVLHGSQPRDADDVAPALGVWLKLQGKRLLVPWLARVAEDLGCTYKRVQIRTQKGRWGSCSARGTISLNAKLLFLPPELAEHVLVHELCHTRNLNHSPSFWRTVAQADPHWADNDNALRYAWQHVPAWAVA